MVALACNDKAIYTDIVSVSLLQSTYLPEYNITMNKEYETNNKTFVQITEYK